MRPFLLNHCVQAKPDCACLFFLSQGSGAPELGCSAYGTLIYDY
jgi:hypothetical protein